MNIKIGDKLIAKNNSRMNTGEIWLKKGSVYEIIGQGSSGFYIKSEICTHHYLGNTTSYFYHYRVVNKKTKVL